MRLLVLSLLALSNLVFAEEAVCKKCQVIREYNAAHPENNYYYYDDYLKDQARKQGITSESDNYESEKSESEKAQDRFDSERPKFGCSKCGKRKHFKEVACNCAGKKKKRSDDQADKGVELACKQCGGDKKPPKEYGDLV